MEEEGRGVQSQKWPVVTVDAYDEEDQNLPTIRVRPLRDLVRNPALFCQEQFQVEEEEEEYEDIYQNIFSTYNYYQGQEHHQQHEDMNGNNQTRKQKQCTDVTMESAINYKNPVSLETNAGSNLQRKPQSKKTLAPTGMPPREESLNEPVEPLAIRQQKSKAKRLREDNEDQRNLDEKLGPLWDLFDFSEKPKLKRSKKYCSSKIQADAVAMWEEMQKPDRDITRLKKLMKSTFKYRQHEYKEVEHSYIILLDFPALRDYRLIKYDMTLLRKMDLKALDAKLTDHLAQMYQACDPGDFLSSDPVIRSALEQLKKQRSNKELLRDIQLLCVGYQVTNGKLYKNMYAQRLEKNEEPFKSAANTPSIDILGTLGCKDTEIFIYCEGNLVTITPNIYEAVTAAYSLYWLFNLKYEPNCIDLFELLDSLV